MRFGLLPEFFRSFCNGEFFVTRAGRADNAERQLHLAQQQAEQSQAQFCWRVTASYRCVSQSARRIVVFATAVFHNFLSRLRKLIRASLQAFAHVVKRNPRLFNLAKKIVNSHPSAKLALVGILQGTDARPPRSRSARQRNRQATPPLTQKDFDQSSATRPSHSSAVEPRG